MLSSVCTFCTVCEFISCDSPVEKAKAVYNSSYTRLLSNLVREAGLEPARPEWTLEPESSESANSTTRAFAVFRLLGYIITDPPACQADFSFLRLFFAFFLPRNTVLLRPQLRVQYAHFREVGIPNSKIGSLLAKTADFVFSLHYR